jgi:hypothetical protein
LSGCALTPLKTERDTLFAHLAGGFAHVRDRAGRLLASLRRPLGTILRLCRPEVACAVARFHGPLLATGGLGYRGAIVRA